MTSCSHWSNLGLGAVSRMTRAAHNMLLVPQLRCSPEEYDEDFHLWLSRAGGPSGGWTHDDHLVLTTLTHRLNLLILCCIHSPFAILQLDKVFTICVGYD